LLGRDSPEAASVPFERVPGRPFAFSPTASDNLSVAALQPAGFVDSRSALDSKLRPDATGVMGRSYLAIGWWWSSLGVPVIVELSMPRPIGCGPLLAQGPKCAGIGGEIPVDRDDLLKMAQSRSLRTMPLSRHLKSRPSEIAWPYGWRKSAHLPGSHGTTNDASPSSGSDFQTGTDPVAEAGICRLLFGFRFPLRADDGQDQLISRRTFPSRADAEETRDAEQHGPTLGRDVWIRVRLAATERHRAAFERARVETRSR